MAYTLRQFITECENYEYSQEYYDLIKECSELRLMERYLENQQFLAESADTSVFSEGYLMEAASPDTTESVKKSLGQKAKELGDKVKKFLKGLIPKLIQGLIKFRNFFDSTTRDITDIYNYFKKNGVDKGAVAKIIEIYGEYSSEIYADYDNQPFNISKLKIDYSEINRLSLNIMKDTPYASIEPDVINNIIAYSLSDTTVLINVAWDRRIDNGKSGSLQAVPVKVISKICKEIMNPKNNSYDYSAAITTLENAHHKAFNNGLEINVNSKDLDKIINELQRMNADLNALKSGAEYRQQNSASSGENNAEANHNSTDYNTMIDGINKINSCVASTLKLYSSYISYRRKFISAMKSYLGLNKDSKNTKTSSED